MNTIIVYEPDKNCEEVQRKWCLSFRTGALTSRFWVKREGPLEQIEQIARSRLQEHRGLLRPRAREPSAVEHRHSIIF